MFDDPELIALEERVDKLKAVADIDQRFRGDPRASAHAVSDG